MKPRARNNPPFKGYTIVVKNGKLMVKKLDGGKE